MATKRTKNVPLEEAAYGLQFNPRGFLREHRTEKSKAIRVSCPNGCGLNLIIKAGERLCDNRHLKKCASVALPGGLSARLVKESPR